MVKLQAVQHAQWYRECHSECVVHQESTLVVTVAIALHVDRAGCEIFAVFQAAHKPI